MKKKLTPVSSWERIVEISTWAIVVIVLFGVRFLPIDPIGDAQTYYVIGSLIGFILLYYLVIYKYFSRTSRFYLKSMADIILIGVLIHLVKDYGQVLYALYFIPIAAAALSLEFVNALLIATLASLFVVAEIFLGAENILPQTGPAYQGVWQISFIIFITIFCRFLAMKIRQEQTQKEESLAREKVLKEETARVKEFISLTSHQLYTPTSIIRGFSSLLRGKNMGELNDKQRDAVEEIYASSKRMADLVSELLNISRIQSGTFKIKKSQTDIAKMLENVVKEIEQTKTDQNVKIELELADHLTPIYIDAEKIRMVVYNLLGNALKYTPRGKISVLVEQTHYETTISVKDEGVGILINDFKKLFQPFFRGTNILALDNKGTGLGLYIARLIIEQHGGKIWATSAGVNKGSKFIFILPN